MNNTLKLALIPAITLVAFNTHAANHTPADGQATHMSHHANDVMSSSEHQRRHDFAEQQAHIHDHDGDVEKADKHAKMHNSHTQAHLHDHTENTSEAQAHSHEHDHDHGH